MSDFSGDDSYAVIGAAMKVHNELGAGLREKPYENALAIELRTQGFEVAQQRSYPIFYLKHVVGDCQPDLIINESLVVDTKAIDKIGENEVAQMLNYLRITGLKIGLVVNFKPYKLAWKRVVNS